LTPQCPGAVIQPEACARPAALTSLPGARPACSRQVAASRAASARSGRDFAPGWNASVLREPPGERGTQLSPGGISPGPHAGLPAGQRRRTWKCASCPYQGRACKRARPDLAAELLLDGGCTRCGPRRRRLQRIGSARARVASARDPVMATSVPAHVSRRSKRWWLAARSKKTSTSGRSDGSHDHRAWGRPVEPRSAMTYRSSRPGSHVRPRSGERVAEQRGMSEKRRRLGRTTR
jgi:hypothetical protein